ncbi:MAG: VWA domain-containing protein [Sphingomonadaceae bacterium]
MTDAEIAGELLAIDPAGLGGMIVRGDPAALLAGLGQALPLRRLPSHIDHDRLHGGLDLTATLATGRPVLQAGLIAQASGGALVVPMAERIAPETAGALAAALDAGTVAVILLDSGVEGEAVATTLSERVAFIVDVGAPPVSSQGCDAPGDPLETLVHTAAALGIASTRASLFALRAARAAAKRDGRDTITGEDIALAIRLVLVPRATQWPDAAPNEASAPPTASAGESQGALADVVLAAIKATLPADAIAAIVARNQKARAQGRGKGARRRARHHGRPVGSVAGLPRGGARLALIATLRAAAPWQAVRGRTGRILIRRDDLRIRRFQNRSETTTIFAVDASGSAAAARMAEAKGAVELLLTRAYSQRAQVALVAFRGEGAEVLLPPTRSLTRARRLLAELPGGGGTPLAAGLATARTLALAERARDRTPSLVVLTDGRGNVPGNSAQSDALAAGRAIAHDGLSATLIDISARPRDEGRALAAAMAGRYVALPRADANALSAAL